MALVVLYLVLGCFVDGVSMIYMTLPVLLPVVKAFGFDLIWFGVILTVLIELGQITPPVGSEPFHHPRHIRRCEILRGGEQARPLTWG